MSDAGHATDNRAAKRIVDADRLLDRLDGLHEEAGAVLLEGNLYARALGWSAAVEAMKRVIHEMKEPT